MYNLKATNKLQDGGTYFATLLTITPTICGKGRGWGHRVAATLDGSSSVTPFNQKMTDLEVFPSEERSPQLQVCSPSSRLRFWLNPRLRGRPRRRQATRIRKEGSARQRDVSAGEESAVWRAPTVQKRGVWLRGDDAKVDKMGWKSNIENGDGFRHWSIYSVPEPLKFTTGGHPGVHPDLVRFGARSLSPFYIKISLRVRWSVSHRR